MSKPSALPRCAIILAGGAGERFWPLSRLKKPKQLLSISGGQSMLRDSVQRISALIPLHRIFVVTGSDLRPAIQQELEDLISAENILGEPARRNTALALAMAAARLETEFQGGDCVTAILTADHAIHDTNAFLRDMEIAMTHAEQSGDLVTFGIQPDRPETGFGYIEVGASLSPDKALARVEGFREKPSPDTAQEFVESGRFLWNSGMFVWRNHRLIEEFQLHLPRTAEATRGMVQAFEKQDPLALESAFLLGDALSIDYGIMERCKRVAVVRASFDWDDVGTWSSVARLLAKDASGNAIDGNALAVECENSLIYCHGSQRLVVGYQLEKLAIIDTEDALLILPLDHVQGVKDVVAQLRKQGRTECL
jgi:mannose-1-phosphate guanylyltransferase